MVQLVFIGRTNLIIVHVVHLWYRDKGYKPSNNIIVLVKYVWVSVCLGLVQ